eukprot:Skav236489  [mRNA]  locus=scaffold1440:252119:253423:+ [translate_table: standard]
MKDVIPPLESYVKRPKDVRNHLKKVRKWKLDRLAVVDENGKWMERWRNQFKALGINYLRSHEMMHPDAFDHSTLSVWAHANKRNDFLQLEDLPKTKSYHGPFVLPSSQMMLDFCKSLVKLGRLDDHLWHAQAESMRPCAGGMLVTVRTSQGSEEIHAKRVVVARGPTWRRQWPSFYNHLEPAAVSHIFHAWDLFDDPTKMDALRARGGKGIIVGGGLTSAHLCAQLAPRGHVNLLIRRNRRVKQYDLGLDWMGTKRWDCRREFEQSAVEKRLAIAKESRDGGSISPELDAVLTELEGGSGSGSLQIHEWTEVVSASFDASWTVVLNTDEVLEADYLICATGASMDVASDPLLGGLQEVHPLPLHGGLPVLTESLQWGSLPVHLMGNLAALELGPDAVNLAGATRGAFRISKALEAAGLLDTKSEGERGENQNNK